VNPLFPELKSHPHAVTVGVDTEVAQRWLLSCLVRKNSAGDPEERNEWEHNSIGNDSRKLEIIRWRLSDLGGWMRVFLPTHRGSRSWRRP